VREGGLVGHDVPFVEEGDESRDGEVDFLWSGGKTHGDGIIPPPLLHKLISQELYKQHQVFRVSRMNFVPCISIIHAIIRKILPVNAYSPETLPLLE
jgi:hypothetical protein